MGVSAEIQTKTNPRFLCSLNKRESNFYWILMLTKIVLKEFRYLLHAHIDSIPSILLQIEVE